LSPATKQKLMEGAYAASTLKTHSNQKQQYEAFCARQGLQAWTDKSAVYWIFWAAEVLQVKKATLKAKLEAYKFFARHAHGRSGETAEYGSCWHLLSRWIQRRPDDATPKRHIGRAVLQRALENWNEREGRRAGRQLAAWYTVSYRALLRAGEAQAMCWEDVSFEGHNQAKLPSSMKVVLRTEAQRGEGSGLFKTQAGAIELMFERRRGEPTCAVQQVFEWWRQSKKPTKGRVFSCSEETARKQLQRLASEVTGRPGAEFGLHSLRAGGATDMEQGGAPLSQIKHLGRWRSAAVLLYLRGGEVVASAADLKAQGGGNMRTAL
jgi:integrase